MPNNSDDNKQIQENEEEEIVTAVVEPEQPVEEANQDDKIEELTAQVKRALADYQNLQRRVQEERQAIGQFATQQVLFALLPIVDQLEQVVETAPKEEQQSAWFQATAMSVKQLQELLKKEGVESITPEGAPFDPNEHEAIDTTEGEEDDKVAQVFQKGYKLHGKIIRAAKVRVSKRS